MNQYFMDSILEGQRIEAKTDLALVRDQFTWAGGGSGQTVLDLGCAAGTCCRAFAEWVGKDGKVIGVDASQPRLDEALGYEGHAPNISYRHGDATAIPLEDNTVDLAWSRFLFEYLPDPWAALIELVRVTRPGGAVCVSDLDGNGIWHSPEPPELRAEIDAALRTLDTGFDPLAGRKIFYWCKYAGLRGIEIDIRPYHLIAGSISPVQLAHWEMKLSGVSQALVARGWTRQRASALVDAFRAFLLNDNTCTYSVLFSVRGTKPLAWDRDRLHTIPHGPQRAGASQARAEPLSPKFSSTP